MTALKSVVRSFVLVTICLAAMPAAKASSFTSTGSLAADNSVYSHTFDATTTQDFTFFTTSYGGGTNADGTHTSAGGFVPVLTLFSSTGSVLAFGGGDGTCNGSAVADATTGICEDAYFTQMLDPGSYTLDLTEFPNVAIGNLSDGFLAGSDTHFTGTSCDGSDSMFLQADLAPCVQRTANYSVNITSASTSPVPEPPTWILILPAAAIALFGRRQFA